MTIDPAGLPRALERLLLEAVQDPEFLQDLIERRLAAVDTRGYPLDPSERAMLASVPEAQLRAVIDGLSAVTAALPELEQQALTGIRPDPPPCPPPTGIRPDSPPPPPAGIRPDPPPPRSEETRPPGPEPAPAGIRPDSPVRGIRPGRLLLGAAVTTAALGGGAFYLTAGIRPDHQPPATQSAPAAEPDRDGGPPDSAPGAKGDNPDAG